MSAQKSVPNRVVPWTRILAEGAVIVVSILAAFAVDAWWDRTQDRAEEEALILNLLAEIADASAELDASLAIHTSGMCSAKGWTSVMPTTPLDSVTLIMQGLWGHRTPSLSLSTVSTVLASGQLSLIQDANLRSWISEWPGVLADFDEELEGIIQYVRFVLPAYFVNAGIALAALSLERHPLFPQESIRSLVGDPGFQSLVQQAYGAHEVLVREGRMVEETLRVGEALASRVAGLTTGVSALSVIAYGGDYVPSPEVMAEAGLPADYSWRIVPEGGSLIAEPPGGQRLEFIGGEEGVFYHPMNASERFEFVREDGELTGFFWVDTCDADAPPDFWHRVR